MKKHEIRSLCISDIHLGNKRNKTENIINNLIPFIKQYDMTKKLDIIFISGDLFDTLLDLPSPEATEVLVWMNILLNFCARNDIKLRVLEGTPSHDWRQSKLFITVAMLGMISTDIKYVDTLYIEHMDDLGIHVLYIPDEWDHSTEETFKQVKILLDKEGINKVDLAIMHGQFNFQLPSSVIKAPKHSESDYLSIVKYYILIGHIHVMSVYERILAPGSFDRIFHNEESPKGGILFTIRNNGTSDFFFIENKNALVFKTITCNKTDIDYNMRYIEKEIRNLPHDSHVRIKASKSNSILLALAELKIKFPFFIITKVSFEEESETIETEVIADVSDDSYSAINIDKENIVPLMLNIVNNKYNPDERIRNTIISELNGAL